MSAVSLPRYEHVVPLRRPDDLYEILQALLLTAGRPVSAKYLADAAGVSVARIIDVLSAPPSDDTRGLVIAWDGHHAELSINQRYAGVVYAATQADTARSLTLIDEYLSAQRQRGLRPNTLNGYREFLVRFAHEIGRPIDEVTTRDIRRFLMREEAERGNSTATIASKISRLSALYKWLHREEIIERNPMARIDAPKLPEHEPRYLTHEEIERIRDAAKGLDRVIFELLYSTGLRREEAVKLDRADVNLNARTVFVRDGKGGKSRLVPMSTRAALELERYLARRTDDNPWLLQSQFRCRMSKESINRRMRKLGEKAGLRERLTPHRLRHSMAKHLRDAGMPLDVVQALLGHTDLRTTQRYAGLPDQQIGQFYRAVFP